VNPTWYCGSNGITDELVIRYLLDRGQRTSAVGYHGFDYSPFVLDLSERSAIGFIDASLESVPRGLEGPSERDVLFAAKADLVVLFWDGKGRGIGELIEFFTRNAKSLL